MQPKIGTKIPKKLNEDTLHRWKVIDRKRQIELQKLDAEQTEVYTEYKAGTHQSNFWQDMIDGLKREKRFSLKRFLQQFLP